MNTGSRLVAAGSEPELAAASAQWQRAVDAILGVPRDARVLLACHINPDGDALGSMLGFALGLRRLGYSGIQASFPGPLELPDPLRGLAGLEMLVDASAVESNPGLVISFDAASLERLGPLGDHLVRAPTNIVVDHHASCTRFGQINLVDPGAAATAVLVERLLDALDVPLDIEIAECLYVALATDTGSFKFDASTPSAHEFAARLIATGLPVGQLSQQLFDTRPYGAVRLFADALGRIELEPAAAGGLGLVWTYATLADLERHNQRPQVLEALIDSVRCVEEADVACVIKQLRPSQWAVSIRSKGGVDVSRVAVALGGGGHRFAAGFTGHGEVTEVIAAVRTGLNQVSAVA